MSKFVNGFTYRLRISTACITIIILCSIFVLPKTNRAEQSKPSTPYTTLAYSNGWIYSSYYGFGANSRVYWTVDENVLTSTNFWTQTPSTTCPSQLPCNQADPYHVYFSLSGYCDGESHRVSIMIFDDYNHIADWNSGGFTGVFN